MTGMFEAVEEMGSYHACQFALSDIECISACAPRKGERGEWWMVRRRNDQSSVYLSETLWQTLMRRPLQIMPVDQGLSLVRFGCDADGAWSSSDRILAWALCWDGEMRPVTRDGVDSGLPYWDPIYVQMPDGTLEAGPHCDRIESLAEGMKLARREWEASQASEVKA